MCCLLLFLFLLSSKGIGCVAVVGIGVLLEIEFVLDLALALAKELLGAIRSKYGTIPIPNSEVSLDGATLKSEAATEKEQLITQLRETLEATSRQRQLEMKREESENLQQSLNRVPLKIYIG